MVKPWYSGAPAVRTRARWNTFGSGGDDSQTRLLGLGNPARETDEARPIPVKLASHYAEAVFADLPVAYYRFQESSTLQPALDATGHGYDGTYGAVSLLQQSALDYESTDTAMGVTSSSGMVSAATPEAPTGHTIEMWAKLPSPTGGSGQDYMLSRGHLLQMTPGVSIGASTGRITYSTYTGTDFSGSGLSVITPAGVSYYDGLWHHIVGTAELSGSQVIIRLYIDGQLIGSNTRNATSFPQPTNPTIGIGQLNYTTSNNARGGYDEVAWYDRALSEGRIQAHYNAAKNPRTSNPPQVYPLGVVAEADLARALTRRSLLKQAIVQIGEADFARPLLVNRSIPIGRAVETDMPRPVGSKGDVLAPLGRAIELDVASGLIARIQTGVQIARQVEVSEARSIALGLGRTAVPLVRSEESTAAHSLAPRVDLVKEVAPPEYFEVARTLGVGAGPIVGAVGMPETHDEARGPFGTIMRLEVLATDPNTALPLTVVAGPVACALTQPHETSDVGALEPHLVTVLPLRRPSALEEPLALGLIKPLPCPAEHSEVSPLGVRATYARELGRLSSLDLANRLAAYSHFRGGIGRQVQLEQARALGIVLGLTLQDSLDQAQALQLVRTMIRRRIFIDGELQLVEFLGVWDGIRLRSAREQAWDGERVREFETEMA